MPQSTVLPAVSPGFLQRWFHPNADLDGFNANIQNAAFNSTYPMPQLGSNATLATVEGGAGGASWIQTYNVHQGRACCQSGVTAVDSARGPGWTFTNWMPGYGDEADYNPGALAAIPSGVVMVLDWDVAVELAGTLFGDDRTGFVFIAQEAGATIGNSLPPDANNGGFGVFVNDDGGGLNALEYLSWDLGGADLERIAIGAGIVPDITLWSTVRFIIVASASGRTAFLTVEVNGQAIVTDRQFGSAELNTPADDSAGGVSARFLPCVSVRDLAGNGTQLNWQLGAKWGRFTPDGTERQAV